MRQEEMKRKYELIDNLVSSVSQIIIDPEIEMVDRDKKVAHEWDEYKVQKRDLNKMIKTDSDIAQCENTSKTQHFVSKNHQK